MRRKPKSRAARRRRPHNRGLNGHRLKCNGNDLEQAFADLWEAQNESRPGLNRGFGTLQDLMIRSEGMFGRRLPFWITQRERVVVATVIQWLGTNCGFSFLCSVLHKAGLVVEEIKEPKEWKKPKKRPEHIRYMRFGRRKRKRRRLP